MKRSLVIVATLATGLVLNASAQTAVSPVPAAKVAVIAFQAAVAQTNEGQRNIADLQTKFEPKRQQLKALSDEIETLTKQLQTQGSTLSEAEQASRARTLDSKKKEFDRANEDAQADFQQQMQDVFNGVAAKVYDVMQAYAQSKGYTVVLDISQQESPVLFAGEQLNITKDVIDAYNVKSGIPAPAAAAPAVPDAPKPAAK
jgi:outer membrane protein